jgi:phage terminase large subunit
MSNQLTMLQDFAPLFLPNHSASRLSIIRANRDSNIKRMLMGEDVNLADLGVKEFVLQSGRVSGKTKHDEYAAVAEIVKGRGDMWYCRSEDADIRNSIFTSMQQSIADFGFTLSKSHGADFKVSYSPFEITHNATGNKIQFFAINKDINRTKGKIPPSGKLKRVMVEEANEVDDGKYIDALITTAVRFFDENSKLVFRLNPPQTRQHWSVGYFDKRVRAGAQYIYTTWEQLANINLLNAATIAEIVKMRQSDPDYYRYWYLGEIVNLTGLVFPHFAPDKHIVTVDTSLIMSQTTQIIVSGDAANKNDATCFGVLCVLRDGRLLLLDALYYDPRRKGQTDDVELARIICDWYEGVQLKYPDMRLKKHVGTVDNANWNLLQMLQKSNAMGWFKWFPATNKHILKDTNRLRGLLREELLLFYVAAHNQVSEVVREIENYVYDEKTQDIKRGQDDHGIDMLKYGTFLYSDTTQLFR